MAYYVRANRYPRERAELRVVIKVRLWCLQMLLSRVQNRHSQKLLVGAPRFE